jgi:hypothetical protein
MNHAANGVKGVWLIDRQGDDGGRGMGGGLVRLALRVMYTQPPHTPPPPRQRGRMLVAFGHQEATRGSKATPRRGIIQEDGPRIPR